MRYVLVVSGLLLAGAAAAGAQERPLVVDATAGYTGFVDDATKHYFAAGGAVRKYLTPRLSVGPEFVFMQGRGADAGHRALMLTGNVVYDFMPLRGPDAPRLTPFLAGGVGGFWIRDDLPTGPFWAADPAFTVGGGIRGRIADRVSAAAEYRFGWELHHRVTASVSFDLPRRNP